MASDEPPPGNSPITMLRMMMLCDREILMPKFALDPSAPSNVTLSTSLI